MQTQSHWNSIVTSKLICELFLVHITVTDTKLRLLLAAMETKTEAQILNRRQFKLMTNAHLQAHQLIGYAERSDC